MASPDSEEMNQTKSTPGPGIQIDVLPDDVLLDIFDFYVDMSPSESYEGNPFYKGEMGIEAWQTLVHVCRRWRSLVLASPRRLNLRLYCTPKTPTRDSLDIWPPLPLIVRDSVSLTGTDNIIAALGHSNRVCQVDLLVLADWQLENVLATMQVPFPELTDLRLGAYGKTLSVIPNSFLGGSAPRLRYLDLSGIPFPGLPSLLSSATHLVHLRLTYFSEEDISPEAIVAFLSVLSCLELFELEFKFPQSRPDWEGRILSPLKRSISPTLHKFYFKGATEYLEDLVTRIDTPQLVHMRITFSDLINFDCRRLAQFINRTPTLKTHDIARVEFDDWSANVVLLAHSRTPKIEISCREYTPDRQFSSAVQVCNHSFPPLSTVEDLYIEHRYVQLVWENYDIEDTLWLQLLLPFTAVKNLYLSKEFAPGVAAVLQKLVGDGITEALPSLQNIFMEGLDPLGPFGENIGHFVTLRQLSGHPVAISIRKEPV